MGSYALTAWNHRRSSARPETANGVSVSPTKFEGNLERAKGIEPSYAAWEAAVLPLNYARIAT